jgi:hypothetical protein
MKRCLIAGVGIVALGLSFSAWSYTPGQGQGGPGMQGGQGGSDWHHPCKAIADACKNAGYVHGGAKSGNGIMANCLKPLLEGQSVKGVSISAEEVAACKAKMQEHHEGGGSHGGGQGQGMQGPPPGQGQGMQGPSGQQQGQGQGSQGQSQGHSQQAPQVQGNGSAPSQQGQEPSQSQSQGQPSSQAPAQ